MLNIIIHSVLYVLSRNHNYSLVSLIGSEALHSPHSEGIPPPPLNVCDKKWLHVRVGAGCKYRNVHNMYIPCSILPSLLNFTTYTGFFKLSLELL